MSEPSAGGGSKSDGLSPPHKHWVPGNAVTDGKHPHADGGLYGSAAMAARVVPAPPTADQLAGAVRALERRLDEQNADFHAHAAEAHPRQLPNLVGSIQAQWQVVPAPVRQVVLIYGAMFAIALLARFIRWFITSFRTPKPPTPDSPFVFKRWPPEQ